MQIDQLKQFFQVDLKFYTNEVLRMLIYKIWVSQAI